MQHRLFGPLSGVKTALSRALAAPLSSCENLDKIAVGNSRVPDGVLYLSFCSL